MAVAEGDFVRANATSLKVGDHVVVVKPEGEGSWVTGMDEYHNTVQVIERIDHIFAEMVGIHFKYAFEVEYLRRMKFKLGDRVGFRTGAYREQVGIIRNARLDVSGAVEYACKIKRQSCQIWREAHELKGEEQVALKVGMTVLITRPEKRNEGPCWNHLMDEFHNKKMVITEISKSGYFRLDRATGYDFARRWLTEIRPSQDRPKLEVGDHVLVVLPADEQRKSTERNKYHQRVLVLEKPNQADPDFWYAKTCAGINTPWIFRETWFKKLEFKIGEAVRCILPVGRPSPGKVIDAGCAADGIIYTIDRADGGSSTFYAGNLLKVDTGITNHSMDCKPTIAEGVDKALASKCPRCTGRDGKVSFPAGYMCPKCGFPGNLEDLAAANAKPEEKPKRIIRQGSPAYRAKEIATMVLQLKCNIPARDVRGNELTLQLYKHFLRVAEELKG